MAGRDERRTMWASRRRWPARPRTNRRAEVEATTAAQPRAPRPGARGGGRARERGPWHRARSPGADRRRAGAPGPPTSGGAPAGAPPRVPGRAAPAARGDHHLHSPRGADRRVPELDRYVQRRDGQPPARPSEHARARESEALAVLRRAETLLDNLGEDMRRPRDAGGGRAAVVGLQPARRAGGGGGSESRRIRRPRARTRRGPGSPRGRRAPLVRALEGVADVRALAIRELAAAGDRDAAVLQWNTLWTTLRTATESGLSRHELAGRSSAPSGCSRASSALATERRRRRERRAPEEGPGTTRRQAASDPPWLGSTGTGRTSQVAGTSPSGPYLRRLLLTATPAAPSAGLRGHSRR